MPKPWKTPQPKERRRDRTGNGTPTPEMLRAAAAAHLADQHTVLWGRAFDLLAEDMDAATDWLAVQVVCVLNELSTE